MSRIKTCKTPEGTPDPFPPLPKSRGIIRLASRRIIIIDDDRSDFIIQIVLSLYLPLSSLQLVQRHRLCVQAERRVHRAPEESAQARDLVNRFRGRLDCDIGVACARCVRSRDPLL